MKYLFAIIWYYLTYPVKYMFKYKVNLAKNELLSLYGSLEHKSIQQKNRMAGRTELYSWSLINHVLLMKKYEKIINVWTIKKPSYDK